MPLILRLLAFSAGAVLLTFLFAGAESGPPWLAAIAGLVGLVIFGGVALVVGLSAWGEYERLSLTPADVVRKVFAFAVSIGTAVVGFRLIEAALTALWGGEEPPGRLLLGAVWMFVCWAYVYDPIASRSPDAERMSGEQE